jgi:hypothetical protein
MKCVADAAITLLAASIDLDAMAAISGELVRLLSGLSFLNLRTSEKLLHSSDDRTRIGLVVGKQN